MTDKKIMKRVVIYARISQDRGGEAVGVTRQLDDCRELIKERGLTLAYEPFVDNNISAYSGKPRPAYREMVKLIESDGIDGIVVYHIDRLYRSPRELEDLIDLVEGKGMVVAPVNLDSTIDLSTSDGILIARIGVAVARKSSDDARRRIKRAMADRKSKGLPHTGGRRRYGYTREGSVIPEEAEVLRQAASDILSGESVFELSGRLNRRGIPTAEGNRWRPNHLRRTLLKSANGWEPILDDRTLALLLVRMEQQHAPDKQTRIASRRYLLTGVAKCASCGTKMYGSGGYYRCARRDGGCGSVGITARETELRVMIQGLRGLPQDRPDVNVPSSADDLLAELSKLDAEEEELGASFGAGRLTLKGFEAATAAIETRRNALKVEVGKVPPEPTIWDRPVFADAARLRDAYDAIASGTVDDATWAKVHETILETFTEVRIAKTKTRKPGYDASRVVMVYADDGHEDRLDEIEVDRFDASDETATYDSSSDST